MREKLSPEQSQQILNKRLKNTGLNDIRNLIRISEKATLRKGARIIHFRGYRGLFERNILQPVASDEGCLVLGKDRFYFAGSEKKYEFRLEDLTCVTTNGNYFEFRMKKGLFYQIKFLMESPLKYEVMFRKVLDNFYVPKKILEYQPHIKFNSPAAKTVLEQIKTPKMYQAPVPEKFLKNFLILMLRAFFIIFIRVSVKFKERIPHNYPFVALANHQSIFDPFILLAHADSRIGFLTKSTSFIKTYERLALLLGRAIPTTRYQTDPMAIWNAIKFLENGIPVGIFPEGERCWDGTLQDFKFGVIRLITELRLPVLPIAIKNSFCFMPRWEKFPKKSSISIYIHGAFCVIPGLYSSDDIKSFIEEIFKRMLDTAI